MMSDNKKCAKVDNTDITTTKPDRTTTITVLNMISVLAVIACVFMVNIIHGVLWWLPIIFLILPIVTLCLMRRWECKGRGGAKAIAIIMIVTFGVLCLSSAAYMILNDSTKDVNEKLPHISESVGIEIPEVRKGEITEKSAYNENTQKYFKYTDIYGRFDEEANEVFKERVEKSGMWISSLDDKTADLFDEVFDPNSSDAFVIYNITEKTYNQLPTTNDECKYIIVVYEIGRAHV